MPEPAQREPARVRLDPCHADITELAAQRGRTRDLEIIAGRGGVQLPALGHVAVTNGQLALAVRPDRWLLLGPSATTGTTVARWSMECAGAGSAIDQSSGLSVVHLAGPAAREVLARSCRLDLHPDAFPVGCAAATVMAQVSTVLAALPSGLLLLTPSTTARHFREWLAATAQPFGFESGSDLTLPQLIAQVPA
jgi:sarcosine oxidase subunit gamma